MNTVTGLCEMRLKEVGTLRSGKSHKGCRDGAVPVYMSGGVVTHVGTAMDRGAAVIVPIRGSLEKQYFVPEGKPFFCGATCIYIKCREGIMNPHFLFHLLQAAHLERLNRASTVPAMQRADLENMVLLVPPMEYQAEAVKILERMRTEIRKTEDTIQQMKELEPSVRNEVFELLERTNEREQELSYISQGLLLL